MPQAAFLSRLLLVTLFATSTWHYVQGQAMCPVVKRKYSDASLERDDPNGPGFREVSGLAFSPTQRYNNRPIFFAVSDGGGGQRIGIFDSRNGRRLLTLRVDSSFFSNRDWESLTIGSCGKSGVDRTCLYIMDAGDNEARATSGRRGRNSYHILKIREPKLGQYNDNDRIPTSRMSRLTYYYDHSSSPTRHADCEAMFLDHKGWGRDMDESVGDIYLATKWDRENQFRYNRLFHIPASAWSTRMEGNVRYYSPRAIGKYDFNQFERNGGIHIMKRTWTNAEMTLDGTLIGLGSELRTFVFLRCPGTSVWSAMSNPDNRSRSCIDWSHPVSGQIETFAWSPDSQRTLSIPEHNNPRLGWTELTYNARESPKVCSSNLTPPPTNPPTRPPTRRPTGRPTKPPTRNPTPQPTRRPTPGPTPPPTPGPTLQPTRGPTAPPTRNPTPGPTPPPTISPPPTRNPTPDPTPPPTRNPTPGPTPPPTPGPTRRPTPPPTPVPTRPPTPKPSMLPSVSDMPTMTPSDEPSSRPTSPEPTIDPSAVPSSAPTTPEPTRLPSVNPSSAPTTPLPTMAPSSSPSSAPTTPKPTNVPTSGIFIPTDPPSAIPTDTPSVAPSSSPSSTPTTPRPTLRPTSGIFIPTGQPSAVPTDPPSSGPSVADSFTPSVATPAPSEVPTRRLDDTLAVDIATQQPTTPLMTVSNNNSDNSDGSEVEAEGQCYGICRSGSSLINPEEKVTIKGDEIACSGIDSVYRDQSGSSDVCAALAISARRAGCLCGQMHLEPDLGTSSDLTEAGYTAILVAAAAFLLIVFVGVRICLYKYSEEEEDQSRKSTLSEITIQEDMPDSPPRTRPEKDSSSKSANDTGLSGIAGIETPKRISKKKEEEHLTYMQSWILWTQQDDRDGGATVDETLDETTDGGKSVKGSLARISEGEQKDATRNIS